jgi:hypothetical protein
MRRFVQLPHFLIRHPARSVAFPDEATMKKKANRPKSNPRPETAANDHGFLLTALVSIAGSENVHILADLLRAADKRIPDLLTAGVYETGTAVDDVTKRVALDYEQSRGRGAQYRRARKAFESVLTGHEHSDAIADVHFREREGAFALGMAFGLRIGGAR